MSKYILGKVLRFSITVFALCLALCIAGTHGFAATKAASQKLFDTPEKASAAIVDAAKNHDRNEVLAIFGPSVKGIILTDDKAVDEELLNRFIAAYEEKSRIDTSQDNKALLYIGNNEWPFPVPIVKKGNKWFFDTRQGKTEIIQRRIGRNELDTVQSCLAYVDAQKDYSRMTGKTEYAQKFISEPGTHNGLYWETKDTEESSPLGVFMARAVKGKVVSAKRLPNDKPVPYHGYYYRILTAQGKNAPGGAHSYIADRKMTEGFALVAYPAQHGITGVMSFIVNQDGIVYEKNLGKNTAKAALAIKTFDPDKTWKQVKDAGK